MRKASDVIRELETRIAKLEKQSTFGGSEIESTIRENMAKIQAIYEAGVLDRSDYDKYMSRFEMELSSLRAIEEEGAIEDDDPSVPKVGDILYSSWGYEMTLVDFYKVIKVTPSGKSVTLQMLENEVVEGDPGYSGYVMPSPREKRGERPIKNKRVSPSRDGYSVKIETSINAYKWDGKKKYYNRMD